MSKKRKNKNIRNIVSQNKPRIVLNKEKIQQEQAKEVKNEVASIENKINEFINENNLSDLKNLESDILNQKIDDGNMILDTLYADNNDNIERINIKLIEKLIFILINLINNISEKNFEKLDKAVVETNETIVEYKKNFLELKIDYKKDSNEIKSIRNEMSTMIATIISIVLSISVITAAVTGIEKIDSNYIIPFTLTLVFLNFSTILFIYILYENKIKNESRIIIIVISVLMVCFWICSFKKTYDISNKSEEILKPSKNYNSIEDIYE